MSVCLKGFSIAAEPILLLITLKFPIGFGNVCNYFTGGYHRYPKRNLPPPIIFFLSFNIKFDVGVGRLPSGGHSRKSANKGGVSKYYLQPSMGMLLLGFQYF